MVALTAVVRTVADGVVDRLGDGDTEAGAEGDGTGEAADGWLGVGAGAQAARLATARQEAARPRMSSAGAGSALIYPNRPEM
ncbi:MAG: hypothetical protein ACOYO9_10820 [Candidatus Nanopelagicales bacterium]